uniref:GDSL esterase/lipase At5g45960-like n=1 Tax=Erigeron canadensis TaxID=72917 RepID=UPI001CB8907E|nr:GDSL esterase/lipase At5g45960-like [Erigeron canadensis]
MRATDSLHSMFLMVIIILYVHSACYAHNNNNKKINISAAFVFGDSTVDPGNNNYLPTIARANYPPYGKDFANHVATGRFSNGRLVTDFIGEFIGLKRNLPPYLDPSLTMNDLMTGVSFASSAGGYDPLTSKVNGALTMMQQLELFKEYKAKLEVSIGKQKTDDIVRRAGYVVSSGTNDFALNYYGPTLVQRSAYPNISDYHHFMWHNIERFLQGLLDEGAKVIGIVGVPPIGCLPAMITLHSKEFVTNRKCIENLNDVSKKFNQMLQNNLKGLKTKGTKIVYGDIYKPIINMVEQKTQYGFEEVQKGCCGTGLIEADFLCNFNSQLCDDVSKYVFWDSVHPTEKVYKLIYESLRTSVLKEISKP